MTVTITQNLSDVTGVDDNSVFVFRTKTPRLSDDGTTLVSTRPVRVVPVAGVLTAELEPGEAVVSWRGIGDVGEVTITVPDEDSDLWSLVEEGLSNEPAAPAVVAITTIGSTFSPVVELAATSPATVHWAWTGGSTTGRSPSINFGSPGSRTVSMSVYDSDGDAISAVETFNLGFDHTQDPGPYTSPSTYNKSPEGVTAISNVKAMTGLKRFFASNTDLSGGVDFSGMSALTHIECYDANIAAVTLTGCSSLVRLCLELNDLAGLDLNPVAASLYDLRVADQSDNALALTALTSNLAHLFHFCTRDQAVTGQPAYSRMPVLQELWNWNTGQTGTLAPAQSTIQSILSHQNAYTGVDLTGCSSINELWLQNNVGGLPQTTVDNILVRLAAFSVSNGNVNLTGCGAPSSTGTTARTTLLGRGWSVLVDAAPTTLFQDTFNRANAANLAAVANGWSSPDGMLVNITSNVLNKTSTGSYQRLVNAGGTTLPANYSVEVNVSHSTISTPVFFFIIGRWNGTTGVRVGWEGGATTFANLRIGTANSFNSGDVTVTADNAFPASWSVNQNHTMRVQMVGTLINVYIDNVLVGHGTLSTNSASTGTSFGIAGADAASLDSITVT